MSSLLTLGADRIVSMSSSLTLDADKIVLCHCRVHSLWIMTELNHCPPYSPWMLTELSHCRVPLRRLFLPSPSRRHWAFSSENRPKNPDLTSHITLCTVFSSTVASLPLDAAAASGCCRRRRRYCCFVIVVVVVVSINGQARDLHLRYRRFWGCLRFIYENNGVEARCTDYNLRWYRLNLLQDLR